MWLFVAFLAVPLIEIALFIQVGGAIGLWPTLLIVVLTAILGTMLVRSQGRQAIANLRTSFGELQDPTEHLAHGAMILFSGALLLTPGFFTDAVGFALLVPGVRTWVFHKLRSQVKVQQFQMGPGPGAGPAGTQTRPNPQEGDVIDGDFVDLDPENRTTHRPSGWTKH